MRITALVAAFLLLSPLALSPAAAADQGSTRASAHANRAQGRVCGNPLLGDHYRAAEAAHPARLPDEYDPKVALTARPKNRVGDPRVFWAFDLSVMPPLWIQVPATCRGVGQHCYVFVADDQWNLNMDADDVQEVLYRWDTSTPGTPDKGIFQVDTEVFGPPPDELDEDPRIYIFYSELGSYGRSVFDGYFDPMNELTEEQAQIYGGHSNEVEMFYMSCEPVNPVAPSTLSVLAHEFEHMIHWNMDQNELPWVDEGCAELAMLFYGVPDPISGFPNNPDNSLVEWDQEWSDYIKSYLFTLYFYEQFGTEAAISALVAEPLNSVSGYEQTLLDLGFDVDFDDLFVDWTVANLLDDTELGDGRYGYQSESLPIFFSWWNGPYPVVQKSGSVEHWACDYQRFDDPAGVPRAYYVDGADDAVFRCTMIVKGDGVETLVREIPLHGDMFGTDVVATEIGYDTPYIVVNNCTDSDTKTYLHGTDLAIPVAATAWDGATPGAGIDADDFVSLAFSYQSTMPAIDATSIDSVLALSGGHTWLDGEGAIGGSQWNAAGDTLTVWLSVGGAAPTIAVADTIVSLVDDTRASVVLGGSFEQTGIEDRASAPPPVAVAALRSAPNPFNPLTTLSFTLAAKARVALHVYDLGGRLVATPFEGSAERGEHAVRWDATGLASGVYVATLVTPAARSTRRLLLLK